MGESLVLVGGFRVCLALAEVPGLLWGVLSFRVRTLEGGAGLCRICIFSVNDVVAAAFWLCFRIRLLFRGGALSSSSRSCRLSVRLLSRASLLRSSSSSRCFSSSRNFLPRSVRPNQARNTRPMSARRRCHNAVNMRSSARSCSSCAFPCSSWAAPERRVRPLRVVTW